MITQTAQTTTTVPTSTTLTQTSHVTSTSHKIVTSTATTDKTHVVTTTTTRTIKDTATTCGNGGGSPAGPSPLGFMEGMIGALATLGILGYVLTVRGGLRALPLFGRKPMSA